MNFQTRKDRIIVAGPDEKVLAEIHFPEDENGTVCIERTFVDASLRGQGIAGKLMEVAVKQIRASGKKAKPVCSYAVSWLESHPEYQDILE